MRTYLVYVFIGFVAIYIYNYVANVLRGLGNSVIPHIFLSVSVVLNIVLDLLFVAGFSMGIKGAAIATVIAQYVSGIGILIYFIAAYPVYRVQKKIFILTVLICITFCHYLDLHACSSQS